MALLLSSLKDTSMFCVDSLFGKRSGKVQPSAFKSAKKTSVRVDCSRDMSRNARNGKFGNFDEISPKIKSNLANSARMAILAIFRQRVIELEIGVPTKWRFWRIRRIRREWRFWRNFAKEQDRGTDEAAILTNPTNSARMAILAKFRQIAIELEAGVPMKRRFRQIRRIRREWRFWRNFAKEGLS